jgi:NADPH-dependent 2,4-dienoyl-CoA reductase/sulfur reductase-like enzyme/rhodanese-related sulfurtransferase
MVFSMQKKILIIGGVAAGATAAAKARRTDESAEITILEKGPYISFANCGIPYYVAGDIKSRDSIILQTPESFKSRYNVNVNVNTEAYRIDREKKLVLARKGEENLEFSYDKLILAPGGIPTVPPIVGLSDVDYFSMRTVEDADRVRKFIEEKKPTSTVIIGGGYIGIEVADAMYRRNLKTTIIEVLDMILPNYPKIIASSLKNVMEENGIEFMLNTTIKKVEKANDKFLITLANGDILETDMLFVSTGIRPNVSLAREAGLNIDSLGAIEVDEFMRTSDKDIYAAGDAVSKLSLITKKKVLLPLAGPANREGRVAGFNAAGGHMRFPGVVGASIVGFDVMFGGYTVAGTGLSYEQAIREGFKAKYVYTINGHHASYYPNAEEIFLQLVFDEENGKILGAFAAGYEDVARKIDAISMAIFKEATVEDLGFVDFCYAPAYGSAKDNINIAGYVAENVRNGNHNCITPEEFIKLYNKEDLQIIDVRSSKEVSLGMLKKAKHIYVDDIRKRINEVDKNRDVYIYCGVGYRGYISAKILKSYGYNVFNITGGYDALQKVIKLYGENGKEI